MVVRQEPIATLDFASLYPSIIRGTNSRQYNLCSYYKYKYCASSKLCLHPTLRKKNIQETARSVPGMPVLVFDLAGYLSVRYGAMAYAWYCVGYYYGAMVYDSY
eukprot:2218602-Rhodomonas_salina.1